MPFHAVICRYATLHDVTCRGIRVQEYLKGDEYVIDTVSRSGVHKCVAIWKYDKRPLNGAPVVYYGLHFLQIEAEPQLRAMVDYIFGVLRALGIQNGAIHSEVKLEERGPVMIEANCRMHGGEGTWAPMAQACLGYSQALYVICRYMPLYASVTRRRRAPPLRTVPTSHTPTPPRCPSTPTVGSAISSLSAVGHAA